MATRPTAWAPSTPRLTALSVPVSDSRGPLPCLASGQWTSGNLGLGLPGRRPLPAHAGRDAAKIRLAALSMMKPLSRSRLPGRRSLTALPTPPRRTRLSGGFGGALPAQ